MLKDKSVIAATYYLKLLVLLTGGGITLTIILKEWLPDASWDRQLLVTETFWDEGSAGGCWAGPLHTLRGRVGFRGILDKAEARRAW
jgi:hypothetical protein